MKKAIYSLITIIFVLSVYFSLNNSVENISRLQNNFNLDSVSYCVENELLQGKRTSKNLTIALNSCAKGQRSMGITGDIFVIRQSDKKLFWDSSVDCKPDQETKLFMVKDGICSLFKEPATCIAATKQMIEKPPKGDLVWQFDDSIEYVDYRYLDNPVEGVQYIIGQGTQTDEANSSFMFTYVILLFGGLIMIAKIGILD